MEQFPSIKNEAYEALSQNEMTSIRGGGFTREVSESHSYDYDGNETDYDRTVYMSFKDPN